MKRRRASSWSWLLLSLPWACGPEQHGGPVYKRALERAAVVAGAGAGASPASNPAVAGGEGAAGAPVEPPLVPPMVTGMMPLSGPYGTEIRIQGEGLGSAARSDVRLLLGADGEGVLTPASAPEIVSWSENELRFRFPFPYEGSVVISTSLGDVAAGEFEPTWRPGPALESVSNVASIASVAHAPGALAVVLDTGPPGLVSCDGSEWAETAIPTSNLREASIRLYTEAGELRAFGLSIATQPVIVDLGPAEDFVPAPSSVIVTTNFHVAGGVEGAAVWFRDGQWSRAVPSAGAWSIDKGPLNDASNSQGKRHVASATLDGSLLLGWAEDVGTFTDDLGVAKHRLLPATSTTWAATATSGSELDDEISNLVMSDRGAGVVYKYCGTDADPFDLTDTDNLCYSALLPTGAKTTMPESNRLRYGFGPDAQIALYCSPKQGLRLIPKLGNGGKSTSELDTLAGDVVAWPCPNVVAVEVDPEGTPLIMVEQEGVLFSPRPRDP
jgi:hypothetical protein